MYWVSTRDGNQGRVLVENPFTMVCEMMIRHAAALVLVR